MSVDSTTQARDDSDLAEFWNAPLSWGHVPDEVPVLRPRNALLGALRRGLPIVLSPIEIAGDDESSGWIAGPTFFVDKEPNSVALEAAAAFIDGHRSTAGGLGVILYGTRRHVSWCVSAEDASFAFTSRLVEPRAQQLAHGADLETDLCPLLDGIAAFLNRYVVFASDAQLIAIVLWIAHTHAIDAFDVSPYLAITSAEKGCGKTRLLELIEMFVARPWRIVSPTDAVLFRKVTRDHPTLLLDEGDATFAQAPEGLRGLLNAGHRRGTTVTRCVGDKGKYDLANFQVFCAKAIAAIGELPGTVADRSIGIGLRRRTKAEHVERFRFPEAQAIAAPFRSALEAWAPEATAMLRAARPQVPDALNDRAAEGWEPLFAIADLAGGEWPTRARGAALALHAHNRDDDSLGVQLLRAIRDVFRGQNLTGAAGLFTAELLTALDARDGEPWHDVLRIDPIRDPMLRGSASRLAKLLRPYSIQPKNGRKGDMVAKGYAVADFVDTFARMLGE